MSMVTVILIVLVAWLAGIESILDQFQFHQPIICCTLMGLGVIGLALAFIYVSLKEAAKGSAGSQDALGDILDDY